MELENIDLDNIVFTTPQKHGDYLVCKVKYQKENNFMIQFPKMKIVSKPTTKCVELEFLENSYSKKIYNLLSNIDNYIVKHISSVSEEWFKKKIPEESITQMYNKFIKSPKTSENNCTVCLSFKMKKNDLITELIDRRNEPISFEELEESQLLECIAEMKYIIFSKDTCFVQWEINTGKLHKKIQKVERYGFIEVPDDPEPEEDIEVHSFF